MIFQRRQKALLWSKGLIKNFASLLLPSGVILKINVCLFVGQIKLRNLCKESVRQIVQVK